MMQAKIVISTSLDPWKNLSIEEYLVNNHDKDLGILYLWKNDKTIVIGKNQNPWRECDISLIEKDKIKLCRRITGGGAVYHGLGNLNFSFIMNKKNYNLERQLKVIIDMCSVLGIEAKLTGRNDLTVNNRKFSGNAFYHKASVSLHHGTLLINENMSNLVKYLKVSKEKIKSKGVLSIKSRVVNLSTYCEGLTTQKVTKLCVESFKNEYMQQGEDVIIEKDPLWFNNQEIQKLYDKNASWDWRYGRVAKFQIILETRFNWGEIQIHFNTKNAIIEETLIYSDCLDQGFVDELHILFCKEKFSSKTLAEKLRNTPVKQNRKRMIDDIADWILSKKF